MVQGGIYGLLEMRHGWFRHFRVLWVWFRVLGLRVLMGGFRP